jgi:hypothetical protein
MGAVDKMSVYCIACPQYGIVTYEQLRSCELDTRQINRLVESGEVIRVHHGIYRFRTAPPCFEQKLMVAQLWCGREGIVASRSGRLVPP